MNRADRDDEGFTLIELMVVVLVIAILLAIAVPTFLGARSRATLAGTKSRVHSGMAAIAGVRSPSGALVSDPIQLHGEEPSLTWVATAPTGDALGVAGDGTTAIVVARPSQLAASAQRGCVSMSYSDRGPGDMRTDSLCDPAAVLMSITGAPINLIGRGDSFADAADLPALTVGSRALASLDLAGMTSEAGEPWPWTTGASVWLRYTPDVDQTMQLNLTPLSSGGEARLSVYTGAALASLANVTYGYNGATVQASAHTTYYVRVATQSGLGAPTTLTLRAGSAGADDFGVTTIAPLASGTSSTSTFNLANATIQPSEPWLNPGSYVTNWFTYTPTVNQTLQIVATGGTNGPRYLAVYTGATLATQTPLAQTSNGVGFAALAGVTYHVQVGTTLADGTGTGTLTLRAGSSGADDFGVSTIVAIASGSTSTATFNLTNATIQPGEPWLNAGSYVSNWFTYTPTANQTVQALATGGTSGTRYVAAYTGTTLSALTPVLQTTNGTAFTAVAGTTYHIQIGTELGSATGTGTLTLRAGSVGADDFGVTTIAPLAPGTTSTAAFSLTNATIQPSEPWLNAGSYVSNWFTYTPTANQTVQLLVAAGTSGTRYVAAYSGATINALTALAQTSNGVGFTAVAGTTYHIQIGTELGSATGSGTLTLRAGSLGADDFGVTAIAPLGSGTTSTTNFDLTNATIQPSEPWLNAGSYVSNWFTYTPSVNQTVQAFVTGGTGGTRYVAAYTGASLGTLTPVLQTSNGTAFTAVAGTTYHIQIGTELGSATGTGTLTLRAGSVGADDFAVSTIVAIAPGSATSATYDLTNATVQPGEPWLNAGLYVTNWFSYTPTTNQTVQLVVTGGTSGTRYIAAYTGSTLSALTTLTQTANGMAFTAVAGTTYHLQVGTTITGASGTGTLTLRAGSAGADDFGVTTIAAQGPGTSTPVSFDLVTATIQPSEPWLNATSYVTNWFDYTPAVNQTIQLAITGGTSGTRYLGVYTGTSLSTLTTLTQSTTNVSLAVTAGTTYRIQVGTGMASASGSGTLTVTT